MAILKDLMIDIETVSASPRAGVLSIGAQYFDPMSDEKGATFYIQIDQLSALQYGEMSADTMAWWSSSATSPEARAEAFGGTEQAPAAAQKFGAFAKGCRPWGNGSVFDVIILEHLFRQTGVPIPWKFWDIRDVRTVMQLAGGKPKIQFDGVPHVAIDDAMHEVMLVQAACKSIFVKPEDYRTDDPEINISAE